MKQILSLSLALAIGALVLCVSPACKKTVTRTIVDTVRPAWQQLPIYNNMSMAALSSYNLGDTALRIGGSYGVTNVPVNQLPFNNFFTWLLPGVSTIVPINSPPFVNSSLASYTTLTSFVVYGTPPFDQYSQIIYTPSYTPGERSVFQQYCAPGWESYPAMAYPVIRNRYAIMPVETVGGSYAQVRFDLLSFDSDKVLGAVFDQDTPTIKSFTLSAAPGTIGFQLANYFCASYYDKFFVGYGGQFFRIDTLGNVKAFGYTPVPYQNTHGIYNMFTVGETLYVNSGGIIFSSTDRGETWALMNDLSQTSAGSVVYRNVGNDLYATMATLSSQIWKVVIAGRNLNFSELNTDGLEPNAVTSLTKCGRYVFATSATGVYYRDTAYFNQLKTPL